MGSWLALFALIPGVFLAGMASASPRPASGVDEIFSVWTRRAEAVKGGQINWSIPCESWNRFGRFETDWAPSSGKADREITGSIRFDEKSARYDSVSFSYVDFGLSNKEEASEVASFRKVLFQAFDEAEYRDLLTYSVLYSATTRIYYWSGGASEYPRAVILPATPTVGGPLLSDFTAFNSDSANNASGSPSAELHTWLTAPVLLAFRPSLFDAGFLHKNACQLVKDLKPVYEGRQCQVLRVLASPTDISIPLTPIERRYWVDPSRDFLVVRCELLVRDHPKAEVRVLIQLDVHYEQMPGVGWFPAKWTAMRLARNPAFVQQVVEARLTNVSLEHSGEATSVCWEFAPGTWVQDTCTHRQYFVSNDLKRLEIDPAAFSYADLLQRFEGDMQGWSLGDSADWRHRLISMTRWPEILIPMTAATAALIVMQRMVGVLRHKARRRAISKMAAELSSLVNETSPNVDD